MSKQVFTNEFVENVKSEIAKQLKDKGSATRATVVAALGLSGHEACISVLMDTGQLGGYRAVKRLGIVAADYKTAKEKGKAAKAKAASTPPAPAPVVEVSPAPEVTPNPVEEPCPPTLGTSEETVSVEPTSVSEESEGTSEASEGTGSEVINSAVKEDTYNAFSSFLSG
jgi:hypothetical protein